MNEGTAVTVGVPDPWPAGFPRIPDEEWTRAPVDALATKYDRVENHGWYANLDPTVAEVAAWLRPGDLAVDYSGGTGIFIDRLLAARAGDPIGLVNVDSSPKFLRLSLEKLREEPRAAFRLLRWRREEGRLDLLDEALPELAGRAAAVVSTNAIHLYYDLEETLASWSRTLRAGGRAFVQSGNIRNDEAPSGAWIIDDTVEAVHQAATEMVRSEARWRRYLPALAASTLPAHDAFRRKVFLPARPLDHYLSAFRRAGFEEVSHRSRPIRARQAEWRQFLSVYHEAVLGWVGGTEKVEGRAAGEAEVKDRLELLALALDRVLEGREEFEAAWTYLTLQRP